MKIKCLSVDVYKFPLGDCTNGGVSGKFSTLLIPCEDGNVVVDSENLPENFCVVEKRMLYRTLRIKEKRKMDNDGRQLRLHF